MSELKVCPCCGSEASHRFCSADGKLISVIQCKMYGQELKYHMIICNKCGLRTKVYATIKRCFNSWNRRVSE